MTNGLKFIFDVGGTMNLKKKIGQKLVVGFDGYELNDHIKNLISNYHVGNVILFERNCKTPEQVFNLVQSLQKLSMEHNGLPLFVMIDQENGVVNRIFDGITVFPGNMAQTVGATLEETEKIAYFTGLGLRTLGINFNLAPSVDVNNNPKNPVIGTRRFGASAKTVAQRGNAYIKGLQKAHVIATAKHFPGHGDTSVDSHLALPIVDHDKKRLEEIELHPFREAIKNDVKAIMSAHIQFPAYDSKELPGTLSYNILTNLLRTELGFEGVIITDCMEMKAIDDLYGAAKATPMAISAGADLICISHCEKKQIAALGGIVQALGDKKLFEEQIDESYNRILELKKEYDIEGFLKTTYMQAKVNLYKEEYEKLAEAVSEKSITLVRNHDQIPVRNQDTLIVAPDGRALTSADGLRYTPNFAQFFSNQMQNVTAFEIGNSPTNEEIMRVVEKAKSKKLIIICTQNATFQPQQQALVHETLKVNENIVLIPLRNPYDIELFSEIPCCLLAYEYTMRSMESLAKVLRYYDKHKML